MHDINIDIIPKLICRDFAGIVREREWFLKTSIHKIRKVLSDTFPEVSLKFMKLFTRFKGSVVLNLTYKNQIKGTNYVPIARDWKNALVTKTVGSFKNYISPLIFRVSKFFLDLIFRIFYISPLDRTVCCSEILVRVKKQF